MIYSLPDFLSAYWPFLLGAAVLCGAASYKSETFFSNLKKVLVVLAAVFLVVAGYELISGRSVFNLPGSIEKKLAEDPTNPETGRRYYKSFEERYGEKPPD
jgi:hypothetical protein